MYAGAGEDDEHVSDDDAHDNGLEDPAEEGAGGPEDLPQPDKELNRMKLMRENQLIHS